MKDVCQPKGKFRRAATWPLALATALSSGSACAQAWSWTVRPESANTVDSRPDSLSRPDTRGFWAVGTALVHYRPDGSLDFVSDSPGTSGGSLAATLSDGSLIVATPSHPPEITFGQPEYCFVSGFSAVGVPRWTQVLPGEGPCAQLAVDSNDTIWVRGEYAIAAFSADGVMRNGDANNDLNWRAVSDVVVQPQGGAITATAQPASLVALDARLNSVWVADDAEATAVYDRLVIGSDGNVFALGRVSGDVAGAAMHIRSVTASGSPRFARDIETIKTDAVLAAAAAPDGGLYVLNRQVDVAASPAVALTRLAADGSVLWNKRVAANSCGFYLPVCSLFVTTQGDLLFVVDDHPSLYRVDANGQVLQSTAFTSNVSALTALANGDALVTTFDSFYELGTGIRRFDRNGTEQPAPPSAGLVRQTAYAPAVLVPSGDSYLAVSDSSGYALARVNSAGVTQWQTARLSGHHSYSVDQGGNRVCAAEYGDESPFAANCFAADSGAHVASMTIDALPSRFLPLRVLDDGSVLAFDLPQHGDPQHVLFGADGTELHRITLHELATYSIDVQTRAYVSGGGTAVLLSNDGLRLTAYDRNAALLYAIEVPEQMHGNGTTDYGHATVHVLPDGSAVLTADKTDAAGSTAYAWKVGAAGATQWLQALTPLRPLGMDGYSFSTVFAAGAAGALYFATSGLGYPATLQARAGGTGQLLWEHDNIAGDISGASLSANPTTGDLVLVLPGPDKVRLLAIDAASGGVRKQIDESCSGGANAYYCSVIDASVSADDTLRVLTAYYGDTSYSGSLLSGLHDATQYASLIRVDQPGIAGSWYPVYSVGQGFTLDYIASASTVFMPWFTFTQDGLLDPAGLAWFAMQGNVTSGATGVDLVIARTEPGSFNSGSAAPVTVGNAHLNFTDCNNATLFYQFNAGTNGGAGGLITLTRLTPGTSPCVQSDGSTTPAQIANPAANGFDTHQSGSWYDPVTGGQGLEMTIIPAGGGMNGLVFAAWFTFDPAGRADDALHQHWFTLQGDLANATNGKVTLPIYRIIGGAFDGAATQDYSQVGYATLTIQGCDTAQLDYVFDTTEVAHAFAGLVGSAHLVKIGGCAP